MAAASLESRWPPSCGEKQLVVRVKHVSHTEGDGLCRSPSCGRGSGRLSCCAFWVQAVAVVLVLVWMAYAHAQLASYNRKLEQITRHVTVLQKHVTRLRLAGRHGRVIMDNTAAKRFDDVNSVDDAGLYTTNSHVTLSRRRRAGRHHSFVDDELQEKPESEEDQSLKRKQKQHCSSSGYIKAAEVTCQRSLKLVSDVKRYLVAVIKRTNIMMNRQTSIGQHPSIHLAAIARTDPYLNYLAWNTSNPMSHVTGSDGRITGRDQAYHVDGTRELVNITESGRYLVYAQVTFMGRNASKDSLETLDCGFRIVIAQSIRYKTNKIGLFSAQSTQYELGRTNHIYVQDSAYVSGVYPFEPGDELAVDVDRGVNTADVCRVNYDAAKTFFGIVWIGRSDPE